MSSSDKQIITAVALIILIHVFILTLGLVIPECLFLTTVLNVLVGSVILLYWSQKQIRITQHSIEFREIVVLGFEVVVVGFAIYSIVIHQQIHWLSVVNFITFGIHLLVLMTSLVFMLTFKIKKLF